MADEITLSGLTIAFVKTASPSISVTVGSITPDVAGTQYMDNVQNMDVTNFVQLRQATGAAAFCKLLAGEWAIFRASVDMTAPFAIADTGACNVRFLRFDL